MKRVILTICIILIAVASHAQSPIRYGITSGINFSKYLSADLNYSTGFQIGVSAELGLPSLHRNMYINSALLLSQKGGKGDDFYNLKINAYYLELPIHIGVKQKLSDKFTLSEEVGPYMALGLFGKTKADSYSSYFGVQDALHYNTFSKSGLKRYDVGLGFKIRTEYMNHVCLAWGLDFSLVEVSKNSKAKNFNTYFALSYLF